MCNHVPHSHVLTGKSRKSDPISPATQKTCYFTWSVTYVMKNHTQGKLGKNFVVGQIITSADLGEGQILINLTNMCMNVAKNTGT